MKFKDWKRWLFGLAGLLLVLEIPFAIKLFIPQIELGSVSDWLSTLFNGIVTITAVAALYKANDYFKDKLTDEDISLWLQINDSVSSIASSVTILWVLYEQMIEQWNETKDIEILKHHYLFYITPFNDFKCQLHKLNEFKYRLDVRSKPYDKRDSLLSLISELRRFNGITFSKIRFILIILTSSNKDSDYPDDIRSGIIDNMSDNLKDSSILNKELQKTYNILREFGIDEHHTNGLNTKCSK